MCGTTNSGWEAIYSSIPPDVISPTTVINSNPNWKTTDFLVDFTDLDSENQELQNVFIMSVKNPIHSMFHSRMEHLDLFREEFEDNITNWIPVTGLFSGVISTYEQSDNLEQNANSYTLVDQQNSSAYLYEWNQTIQPNSSNQRAGMHFFCDNPSLTNRGNSYFIYLRGSNAVQNLLGRQRCLQFRI